MDARNFDPPPNGPHGRDSGPPALAIALVLGTMAVALVAGYFLVMKLVDMSRTEDCLMSGRRNCAPVEMPMRR
jgi:hypothetical protein